MSSPTWLIKPTTIVFRSQQRTILGGPSRGIRCEIFLRGRRIAVVVLLWCGCRGWCMRIRSRVGSLVAAANGVACASLEGLGLCLVICLVMGLAVIVAVALFSVLLGVAMRLWLLMMAAAVTFAVLLLSGHSCFLTSCIAVVAI